MNDLVFCFLCVLMIFIYSCAKIVFRYLKERKIMSESSSNALIEIYLKEAEASAQKRQAFLTNTAGVLSGAGLGLIIGFLLKAYAFAEDPSSMTMTSFFIITGCVMIFGGAGMLLGSRLNKMLDKRK